MKFGGTSVAGAQAMRDVARLVEEALPRSPLVVLSAMAGVTNDLIAAAKAAERGDQTTSRRLRKGLEEVHELCGRELFEGAQPVGLAAELDGLFEELRVLLRGVYLLRELTPRNLDAIASLGERLSTRLFASYMLQQGVDVRWIDAREILRTDARFGSARPQAGVLAALAAEHLAPHLAPGRALITQGFIGATETGLTTTLGRGGSDYSAALFGAALRVEEVQIWTDVEGILTCDPRVVPTARTIPTIAFAEAAELAAFGAKVLHPATIQPAVEAEIPVTVRHTRKPDGGFTTIQAEAGQRAPVTALATRGPVTVMTVSTTRMFGESGFLARLFDVFGRLEVSVDLVATAEVSVSLTVEPDAPIERLVAEIERFARVDVTTDRSIVAVVGGSFRSTVGITRRVFSALAEIPVEMISMGANEINLSLVVQRVVAPDVLRALHAEFFESCGFEERGSEARGSGGAR